MAVDLGAFVLGERRLREIRDNLCARILDGLRAPDQQIRAFPAYLRRAPHMLSGQVVAVDVGGTNMRAAAIRLEGRTATLLSRPPSEDSDIMKRATKRGAVSGARFFERQVELVVEACERGRIQISEAKVAYCFSYPAKVTPDGDATPTKWTKMIDIEGVIGVSVGRKLAEAIFTRTGRNVGRIPVLNDTVASLLAASFVAPEFTHHIGLIVGTGTNMAGFFPVKRISKLTLDQRRDWRVNEEMAVNLESGNFLSRSAETTQPSYLTQYDKQLDNSNPEDHPEEQIFEKAVSGAYVPQLLRIVVGDEALVQAKINLDKLDMEQVVADLRSRLDVIGRTATALVDRSADLVAAAIVGLVTAYGPTAKRIGVLAEGSPFHETSGYYRSRVKETLAKLLPTGVEAQLVSYSEDYPAPNFLGAACAAFRASE